jgi:hypothetical protein
MLVHAAWQHTLKSQATAHPVYPLHQMSLPAAGAWPASLARPRITRDASVSESSKTTSSKQQLHPQECQHFTASAAIAAAHTAEVKQAAGHTMPRYAA